MIIFSDDTIITMANAEVERLSGYSCTEIEGKEELTEFVHPRRACKDAILSRTARQRSRIGSTKLLIPPNHPLGQRKKHFSDRKLIQGTRLRVASLVDITERKHVEDQLDYQVRLLNSLLDNLPVGVFMVEVPTGRPLVANEQAKMLLGRDIMPDVTKETLPEAYKAYRNASDELYPIDERLDWQGHAR